jgi:hypothetical protein
MEWRQPYEDTTQSAEQAHRRGVIGRPAGSEKACPTQAASHFPITLLGDTTRWNWHARSPATSTSPNKKSDINMHNPIHILYTSQRTISRLATNPTCI